MTATKEKTRKTTRYKYTDAKKEHLHTLDGKPLFGTSTVCKIIGNGGAFSWWASGKAVEKFGWVKKADTRKADAEAIATNIVVRRVAAVEALLNYRTMSVEEYQQLLDNAYRAHEDSKQESAGKGVDLHAELEAYVKGCLYEQKMLPEHGSKLYAENPRIQPFINWCVENVDRFLWSEAHCYSEKLWCGGISDAGALMKDGKVAVIDFKSSKDAYFGQFVQCAGYALQIEENGLLDAEGKGTGKPKGKVDALYVVPFGAEDITPRVQYDVDGFKQDFRCAVQLYKSSNNFNN